MKGTRLPRDNIASLFNFMNVYVCGIYPGLRVSCQACPSPSSLGEDLIARGTRWSALHIIQIAVLAQVIIAWIVSPIRIMRPDLFTSDQDDVCASAVTFKSYVKRGKVALS